MIPVLMLILVLLGQNATFFEEDYVLLDSYKRVISTRERPMRQHTRYICAPNTPLLSTPDGDTLAVLFLSAPFLASARDSGNLQAGIYGPCLRQDLECSLSEQGGMSFARCTTTAKITLYDPYWTAVWRKGRFRTDIATINEGTYIAGRAGEKDHVLRILLGGWVPESATTRNMDSTMTSEQHDIFGSSLRFKEEADSTRISGRWLDPRRTLDPETYELVLYGPNSELLWRSETLFRPDPPSGTDLKIERFTATVPTPSGIIASCEILPTKGRQNN